MEKSKNGCNIGPYYAGVLGYVDDLFLLCLPHGGLQQMLDIAQKYANEHTIEFSTNPDPRKSKTKGIIFKNRNNKGHHEPEKLILCGNPFPWGNGAKYLGNRLTDKINGLQDDTVAKRARYIERNCVLM